MGVPGLGIKAIGHMSFCVSDIERSIRFWCDGLGFERLHGRELYGSSWKRILEIEGDFLLATQFIRRGHVTIEFMAFKKPGHIGSGERRAMNKLGFTHLAIWCEDIDAVEKRVVEYGGAVVEESRTTFDHPKLKGKWLFCTDPDGIRIELVHYPAGEGTIQR